MGCAQNNITASLVIEHNHYCDKCDYDEINDGDDDIHHDQESLG